MDIITSAISKKYVNESLVGVGALKGAPCMIKTTEVTDAGLKVIFEWQDTSGTSHTTETIIPAGPPGEPGASATVAVGTVTTGEPGTDAVVINSGTENAAVLNFTIPRGETGTGVPDGGTAGQLLSKTESGTAWIDPPQSGGGSSGAEEFKVTFTIDSSEAYVADKTYSEIFDAYIAGKKVYGVVVNGTNDFLILTLGAVSGDEVSFYSVFCNLTEGGIAVFSIPRIGAGVDVGMSQLSFVTTQ